ncbi:zinc finger domain-containing protein [Streptomyces tricolor]
MTEDEVVGITRYVRAVCPQQKIDEFTADAWEDFLLPYGVDETLAAIRAHITRGNAFISIGEIVAEITSARTERAADIQGPGLPPEIPDADPDDVAAYLAAVRAQRIRAADGQELKRRPVAELLAGVGRDIPREITAVRRPGPLGVTCPDCRAPIGRPCRTGNGRERAPHENRETAALQPRTEETA